MSELSGEPMSPPVKPLECDCGSIIFLVFGPYRDDDSKPGDRTHDPGLRRIYTCGKCGDQLRVYQATKMKRKRFQENDKRKLEAP